MIELNEIKVKEKPRYVKPTKKKKKDYTGMAMILLSLFTMIIVLMIGLFESDKRIEEQQAEIDRLQNKVYQDIELIDSLKQTIY